MLSSSFWIEPHFTGVVLILGALLFLGGASLYAPIKDEKGSFIFGFSPEYRPVDRTGNRQMAVIPEFYVPITRWTGVLFVIYTVLAFSALAAYGGAMLATPVLTHWVGWPSIVYGLAGLGFLGINNGAPPFLYYLIPMLIGILLL